MTRRRTVICLALALVFASSLGAGWVYLSDSRRVTREQLERVEKGMTRDQVVAVLGHPPGNYASGPCLRQMRGMRYWNHESWVCDEGELLVEFDEKGTAARVEIWAVMPAGRPTIVERMREWVGF